MSSLVDLLSATIKDSALEQLSGKLGRDPRITSSAIDSALPMLIGAIGRSASKDNAHGLNKALDTKHDGSVLDDVAGFVDRDDNEDGNAILGHVLGGSRGLAAQVLGAKSGLDANTAQSLLATLAPIALGALGKAKRQQGMADADIGNLLADEEQTLEARSPGLIDAVSGLLDADGDGDTDVKDLLETSLQGLTKLF